MKQKELSFQVKFEIKSRIFYFFCTLEKIVQANILIRLELLFLLLWSLTLLSNFSSQFFDKISPWVQVKVNDWFLWWCQIHI